MKRLVGLFGALVLCTAPLFAQSTPEVEKVEFNRHWYLQLQGGAAHTIGEADFGKLLSPSVAISGGYQFTPVWGLRVGLSGWQAKGSWLNPQLGYKFNFMQLNADVVVDLANWIGGFKYNRTINPYVLVGVGGNFAFNNDQAQAIDASGYKLSLLWDGGKAFVAGRAGVGVNFRICDRLLLGLEVNTNMLSDRFNSKKANNADWQINALAGVTFRLGKNYKKSAPAPVYVPPTETPQPAPVAEQPAPIVEPAPAPAPTPIAETPAPVRKDAPAPPSPESYLARQDIFFALNASVLRESEEPKLTALIESLKANPKARVSVVGYADSATGNSQGNYWLSGWRALRVREALEKGGISRSRIDMNFVGDKEQPYSDVEDNRVAICIVR